MKIYNIKTGMKETDKDNKETDFDGVHNTYLVLADNCEQAVIKLKKSDCLINEVSNKELAIESRSEEYIEEVEFLGTIDIQ